MQALIVKDSGDFLLTDTYDSDNSSFGDFLNSPSASAIMLNTYDKLCNNPNIEYYELGFQLLCYIGKFTGCSSFVSPPEPTLINQSVNGEYITPLMSIQIDQGFLLDNKPSFQPSIGQGFIDTDFSLTHSQMIPVLLGDSYNELYKIGDSFIGYYASGNPASFCVKGFLKDDAEIVVDSEKIILDNYIIMPTLNLDPDISATDNAILLSLKCEGFIHYSSREQFFLSVEELEQIKNETGFAYSIPGSQLENNNFLHLALPTSILLFIASVVFYFAMLICLYRKVLISSIGRQHSLIMQCVILFANLLIYYLSGFAINYIVFYQKRNLLIDSLNISVILLLLGTGLIFYGMFKRRQHNHE
ncbi:MAG: hypothetical protein LBR14_02500 [Clostridiales Family XIII bacterium]|nr:hypothetical protein [Clostridiales Family XIII bacterium]